MADSETTASPSAAAPTPEGDAVATGAGGEGNFEVPAPDISKLKPQPPCVDLSDFRLKVDHFDKMHGLGEDCKLDGAPNFRQVAGFPIFGTGQPTKEGYKKVLEQVPKKLDPTTGGDGETPLKVIWYNMRQEPVVYLDGVPFAPRHPDHMHENLLVPNPVPDLEYLQGHFTDMMKRRLQVSKASTLKIHKDASFTENPMERQDVEEALKVSKLSGLNEILSGMAKDFPTLVPLRVPVVEEQAPAEFCFDLLVESLKNEPASTQCVFSCQMGRGRTTLGMIVACLIKEIQVSTELRKMADIQLVPQQTIDDLIMKKFNAPLRRKPDDDDPLIRGEFDVIKELLATEPSAAEGKKKIDHVIDVCGPAPKGNGLQNLRECIIETKWKYDVAPEEKQVVWKQMILNFMERYFYLICFASYALNAGPGGFQTTFKAWMDERPHLRKMIEEGKDKLEWYRQVDPTKLSTLKDLINAPNYKDNLGTLIKTIYEFAFLTYSDLPRGPIKNNSMRKLAAKTLMEILPPDIGVDIQKKLDEHMSSPDFVTLIGLVSYHGKDAAVS